MRRENLRQKFKGEFVLIAVTKTAPDNCEVLEGDVLAHSPNRDESMTLLGRGVDRDVTVEWCGEPDETRVVVILGPTSYAVLGVDCFSDASRSDAHGTHRPSHCSC